MVYLSGANEKVVILCKRRAVYSTVEEAVAACGGLGRVLSLRKLSVAKAWKKVKKCIGGPDCEEGNVKCYADGIQQIYPVRTYKQLKSLLTAVESWYSRCIK
mmetsp:Transcript_26679/g.41763  ORF Transcript_26679/g.41763 Transcript_26679/m.41763 type:complete len:102 (-) Transcript_26679:123-428(-)